MCICVCSCTHACAWCGSGLYVLLIIVDLNLLHTIIFFFYVRCQCQYNSVFTIAKHISVIWKFQVTCVLMLILLSTLRLSWKNLITTHISQKIVLITSRLCNHEKDTPEMMAITSICTVFDHRTYKSEIVLITSQLCNQEKRHPWNDGNYIHLHCIWSNAWCLWYSLRKCWQSLEFCSSQLVCSLSLC